MTRRVYTAIHHGSHPNVVSISEPFVLKYLNRHWLVASLAILPILAVTLFYLPLHLGLGVPVHKLYAPFLIFCLIEPSFCRAIYWAQPILVRTGDTRPLYLVTCLYAAVFLLGGAFFGTRFGFFDAANLTRNCIVAAILGLSVGPLGYYANRWIFPRKKTAA
jgi:hypothetical protein